MSAETRAVSDTSFERDVIERSRTAIVVVDFWAPWCGPCQVLGPVLERAVARHEGLVELVKINVDEEPELAQQYQVRGIPAVKAVRDGAVVAEFVGAQPQAVVDAWVDGLLPSEADVARDVALELARRGDTDGAIEALTRRVEAAPQDHDSLVELARLHGDRGETARALELLERLPDGSEAAEDAAKDVALYRMIETGRTVANLETDSPELSTGPAAGRFALAGALWRAGRYEDALDALLALLERDRAFQGGSPRLALLAAFERMGSGQEAVERARRRMAMILFS